MKKLLLLITFFKFKGALNRAFTQFKSNIFIISEEKFSSGKSGEILAR